MTAFSFSDDQLRSAPPEVRRWLAGEIARSLRSIDMQHPEPHAAEQMTLSACTTGEALQIFELIGHDPIATRLFFELAREGSIRTSVPGLNALRTADLLHHTGLPGQESLIAGLTQIDRAFHQIHGGSGSSLLGSDGAGHIFIHENTQLSIRRIWQELIEARTAREGPPVGGVPRSDGFVAPHVGPSEDVATHAATPAVDSWSVNR